MNREASNAAPAGPELSNEDADTFKLSLDNESKLYDDHIRLSLAQRGVLSIGSAFMALADPYRDGKLISQSDLATVVNHNLLICLTRHGSDIWRNNWSFCTRKDVP